MTRKYLLFVSITIIYLSIISLIAPVNSLRVIYKRTTALKSSEGQNAASNSNTGNVHTADIISAPMSCAPGQRLDFRNQCRQVNTVLFVYFCFLPLRFA